MALRVAPGHLAHHLRTAILITCAVYWASVVGWMGALDSATLYAAARLDTARLTFYLDTGEDDESRAPRLPSSLVLSISRAEYESTYRNTSPLDREKLRETLEPLLNARSAKLLVLDIDVSPSAPDDATGKNLDVALDTASGPPLVLVVPSFVGTPELARRQAEWMSDRCQASKPSRPVYFGLPGLATSGGTIVRHPEVYPSVGNVARWIEETDFPPGAPAYPTNCSDRPRPEALCEFHKAIGNIALLRDHFARMGLECANRPIDFSWMRRPAAMSERVRSLRHGQVPADLKDQVMFVGGSYDNRDVYPTAAGPVDGVLVHASIYASRLHVRSHLFGFVVEIALGILLGFAFAALFSARESALGKYLHQLEKGRATDAILSWTTAGAWLGLVLMVLFCGAIGLIYLSAAMLQGGTWLNPVPLVIGMLVEGVASSLSKSDHQHSQPGLASGRLWLAGHLGVIAACAAVTITVGHLCLGALNGH